MAVSTSERENSEGACSRSWSKNTTVEVLPLSGSNDQDSGGGGGALGLGVSCLPRLWQAPGGPGSLVQEQMPQQAELLSSELCFCVTRPRPAVISELGFHVKMSLTLGGICQIVYCLLSLGKIQVSLFLVEMYIIANKLRTPVG